VNREMVSTAGNSNKKLAEVYAIIEDYQRVLDELRCLKCEYEQNKRELEREIERSNTMAVEAEIFNFELNQILNTSLDGLMLIDRDFTVRRINKALCTFLHEKEEAVTGKKCFEVFPSSWCRTDQCSMKKIIEGEERVECDITKKRSDGIEIPFIYNAMPFRGLDGEFMGIVTTFKNITERKQAETALRKANEILERLATVDGLTQVANRRCFDQTITREWNRLIRNGQPLSLILCDVDFFKSYNDTCGHLAGDDCLRAVAGAIDARIRRGGDCVARYGGEEFAVILPGTFSEGAVHVAELLRRAVEKLAIEHPCSPVRSVVTISLGVATAFPANEVTPEILIQNADKALYEAKASGRNCVTFRAVLD